MGTIDRKLFKLNKLTLISCIISIMGFALFFLIFSLPEMSINDTKVFNKPFVSFHNLKQSNQEQVLSDQALIFDSEPIFLPSDWNSSPKILDKEEDEPLFKNFAPHIALYDYKTLFTGIDQGLSSLSSIDILNSRFINPFNGIGQQSVDFSPLKIRTAFVSIKSLNDFEIVQSYEIDEKPDFEISAELWTPIEFLLIVDESGPITPLLITEGSGIEEIDNFFKSYVSKQPKLNSLSAGYYEISVSP